MRRAALVLTLTVAACGGTAPAVAPPPALGTAPSCTANAPPPGYTGPVSPFAGPCPAPAMMAPRPDGVWDYSQGSPPRAVRGQ